jgi:aspartyl-tRNA(Asn)/glutamyl-tRNA(Gln) amidotransferase subunit C
MKITDEIVNHIAHLSRLEFKGSDQEAIKNDMEKIIGFMAKLSEVPTENVEPLIFMSTEVNRLREDVSVVSVTHEEALKNAPKRDSDYFRIPKVLDK